MAKRDITYINKDFDGFKTDLLEYIQKYFPQTFGDFNETSAGMAFIELVAYVGDVLSFYLDRQFQELFLSSAIEYQNVVKLAEMLGYTPRGKVAAQAPVTLSIIAPSTIDFSADTTVPSSGDSLSAYVDSRVVPKVKSGTVFLASNNATTPFELIGDVDFNSPTNRSFVQLSNTEVGIFKSNNRVTSGLTKTFTYNVAIAQKFLEVSLPDSDVLEIISVLDSQGNEWQEVDYLARSNVFVGTPNPDVTTTASASFIMSLKPTPRRFIKRRTADGNIKLVFGSGTKTIEDTEFIPVPSDFVLPQTIRGSVSGSAPASLDPTDLLETKTLGVAPENTSLTITYRIGGGLNNNVASGLISKIFKRTATFTSSSQNVLANQNEVINSLTVINTEPASGGDGEETAEEVKHNAAAFFSAQNRIVTVEDYVIRAMAMPSDYGSIFRIQARRSPNNNTILQLLILSQDANGSLEVANSVLKSNLATYLESFRVANDIVEILNGTIINMGVEYRITVNPTFNRTIVLNNTLEAVKAHMALKNFNFQTNIITSDIQNVIHDVPGVRSVIDINLRNITDAGYSSIAFNVMQNTRKGEVVCPDDSIFEVKHLNLDISGVIL